MVLLYIRYIIGRCKIEKKCKILRTPSICHCEERSDAAIPSFHYVIPVKTGIYLLNFFLFFFISLCRCELSKKVWQSHCSLASFIFYLSLRARIYQGVAIPSSYIFQYSLFFQLKNYKKTIIIINITIFTL